jgi:hypothetical protein
MLRRPSRKSWQVGRPRDDIDTAKNLATELAELAAQLTSMKGEANAGSPTRATVPSGTVWRTPTLLSRRPRWRRGGAYGSTRGASSEDRATVLVAEDVGN